ncbi:ataxin-1-like isoform 1-T3 [Spinachia spinachia]
MKSNQERSNGCLPPKKREILALEQRPVVVATATPPAALVADSPHTENLAWLASVASERCRFRDAESPRCPTSSSSTPSTSISYSATPLSTMPLASPPAVYPTALHQQAGTIQFAQLGPNVQFISSGPYAGYISSHIIAANAGCAANSSTLAQRPQLEGYTTALISPSAKGEQQFQIGLSPTELTPVSLPGSPHVTGQYIHLDNRTPLAVSGNAMTSPTAHLQLHPHAAVLPQTLTIAPSQLLVQYADGSIGKKPEGHAKGVLNGESEVVKHTKSLNHQLSHQHVQSYEARHILLPADYTQNPSGLQTSLVLLAQPNHGAERDAASNKFSFVQTEKGGICLGKPVSRSSSFTSLSSSDVVKSVAPHTVIQTSLPPEELPSSLYSATQPPIIGYITSTNQHAVSYHAALPQHLVIPSGQSLLIPVSGTNNGREFEVSRTVSAPNATTTPQISTAMPHAYLATALSKCEALGLDGNQPPPVVAQAPVAPAQPSNPAPAVVAAPSPTPTPVPSPTPASISSPSSPVSLPPFFMRGSIIQLADGELKRVEDLKTEDFIQSAEISSELTIDSSTVERIDSGQSPNAVVIQFSVGELKAQVCVEVLVEYPFFVFGQGWSSCCPDRTTQLFELSCAKLCVGDVCVSLTLRSMRTTSVTDGQFLETKLKTGHFSDSCHTVDATVKISSSPNAAGRKSGLLVKASSADRLEREQVTGPGPGPEPPPGLGLVLGIGERIYGAGPLLAVSGSVEVRQEPVKTDMPALTKVQCSDPERPAVRKRRWSAPERDQTERAEEEPPLTLPKPSFITQEVKISIEGHSSVGSERCLNKRIDC